MADPEFTSLNLLRAAAQGDAAAEGELISRYRDRLLHLAANRLPADIRARLDPDDVIQSACRVFINRLREGDVVIRRRGDLWEQLVNVTLNKIRSDVRKHRRLKRTVFSEQAGGKDTFSDQGPMPEDACLLLETVDEVLSTLPKAKQRQVLLLRLQGESTSEIAASTGFCVERVRQIIRKIKKQLEANTELSGREAPPAQEA